MNARISKPFLKLDVKLFIVRINLKSTDLIDHCHLSQVTTDIAILQLGR